MSRMRNTWKQAREALLRQIAEVSKKGGLNVKPLEDALKSFDASFAPLLDKVAEAYKANKGEDVKKHAAAALAVGQRYLATLQSISHLRGGRAGQLLAAIVGDLKKCQLQGMAAPKNLVLQ